MTLETKTFASLLDPGSSPGSLSAVVSTFGVVDKDGDVVLASAFTPGQEVMMVWSHDWDKPIGKGQMEVQADKALFHGRFNLATTWGRDAYEAVKFAGALQEYSWGFRITDHEFETRDGVPVRVIKGAQVYEVSPVLVGAGEGTRTVAVKRSRPLADQIEELLADLEDLGVRVKSLADLRAKEGRALSAARRERLSRYPVALREVAQDLDDLLEETRPPDKAKARIARVEYERIIARLEGVAV